MRFDVKTDISSTLGATVAKRTSKAEVALANEVEKDTRQFVPMLTGSLNTRTRVVGNTIIYPGPYARYLYNGKVMVDASTGKGPMRIVDKLGNEYIRFRKGAVLKPTDRPLQYTKDFHKDAGPRWFERSKAQNLKKWLRFAKKVVASDGRR